MLPSGISVTIMQENKDEQRLFIVHDIISCCRRLSLNVFITLDADPHYFDRYLMPDTVIKFDRDALARIS